MTAGDRSEEKLISAAHPKGERCNFALKRLPLAVQRGAVEYTMLKHL